MESKVIIIIILSCLVGLSIILNIVLAVKPGSSLASSKISLTTTAPYTQVLATDDCIPTVFELFVPYYNQNTPPVQTDADKQCDYEEDNQCDIAYFTWANNFFTFLPYDQQKCLYDLILNMGNSSDGSFDDSACDLSTNDYSQDTVNAFCLFLHNMYAYIVREQNPRIIMQY